MLAASDREGLTQRFGEKKAKAFPGEVREGGRGHATAGLGRGGMREDHEGTRPRPSRCGLSGTEAHRGGQRSNVSLQQSPGITWHNPGHRATPGTEARTQQEHR